MKPGLWIYGEMVLVVFNDELMAYASLTGGWIPARQCEEDANFLRIMQTEGTYYGDVGQWVQDFAKIKFEESDE